MRFWEKIRNGTLPITRSRGRFWDMHQYYCLFNATRVPEFPIDRIYRYFKTEARMQWADKSWNIIVCKDGQVLLQGDVGFFSCFLIFIKQSFRVNLVRFEGYGNDLARKLNLYMDTVVQIALQLAFLRTHGSFAPIYETASTRKFYHGRTETVRGCTHEMVAFGQAIIDGQSKEEQQQLFFAAYEAHNKLMDDCMDGRGIDRHLYGLRKTLENFRIRGSLNIETPEIFTDEAWKVSGGDGNYLLSTSFSGYMADDEVGFYGFVTAMRPDGYGTFYRIGRNSVQLVITDWCQSKSNLSAYGENIKWSLTKLGSLFTYRAKL
ncbi:unnamed protein product [Angiostrongylus costaricensis]|uniref:Carn_acyltransf domain-containing protein n=1 Tax=Angiostrongylus costaricensis TaxID=334426 RepID=A0A0R3PAE5_ANGCS|nr:unnamed protein product [Angiostrongylus costaricensis]